ncbi:MAG: DUF2442 domain-containing protein [Chloroflexi bacterium]|nr:DUF2442 domain-containing protein [Chloroflexota bacterium]
MITLVGDTLQQAQATNVRFEDDVLFITLSDGRELSVPLDRIEWLQWLREATPAQRANWEIEPGGFAVYWPDLDDGVEIEHLLSLHALA